MSCGCGGICQDRINSLEDGIRLLEQRLFYLEAKITSTQPVRDPYTYPTTVPRNTKISVGCPVCGIGSDGRPMGYVCSRIDCPTRIT